MRTSSARDHRFPAATPSGELVTPFPGVIVRSQQPGIREAEKPSLHGAQLVAHIIDNALVDALGIQGRTHRIQEKRHASTLDPYQPPHAAVRLRGPVMRGKLVLTLVRA